MICSICTLSETHFDLNKGQRIEIKHPHDVAGIICSSCLQILISSNQEKIRTAYQKALDAGLMDKAKALETFLEQEEQYVRETRRPSRDMDRKGVVRKIRPASHKIRKEHTVRKLDKRRATIRGKVR